MILTIRTDKPEAELALYRGSKRLAQISWLAGRKLSLDIHKKIEKILKDQEINYTELEGIILYGGPGSFTGLRIGASVANTMAFELDIPIAAAGGEAWIEDGMSLLKTDFKRRTAVLEYGSEPRTTKPKK